MKTVLTGLAAEVSAAAVAGGRVTHSFRGGALERSTGRSRKFAGLSVDQRLDAELRLENRCQDHLRASRKRRRHHCQQKQPSSDVSSSMRSHKDRSLGRS